MLSSVLVENPIKLTLLARLILLLTTLLWSNTLRDLIQLRRMKNSSSTTTRSVSSSLSGDKTLLRTSESSLLALVLSIKSILSISLEVSSPTRTVLSTLIPSLVLILILLWSMVSVSSDGESVVLKLNPTCLVSAQQWFCPKLLVSD